MRVSSPSVRRALAGGVLLLGLSPATSLAAVQVELRPAAGAAGSTATLTGSGFEPSAPVRVGGRGLRGRTVRTSAAGAFTARVKVPSSADALGLVSRAAGRRITNRFVVTSGSSASAVAEVATTGGRRVRLSPIRLLPGGRLELRGAGFAARRTVRLTGFGASATVEASRRGTFATALLLPAGLARGASRLSISGGGVRLSVRLTITAPASIPTVTTTSPVAAVSTVPAPPPPAPVKPSNTRPPAVAALPVVGRDVSADPGAWEGDAPIAYAYQWQRCTTTRCAAITGATAATYRVATADAGRRLQVVVSASNAAGSAEATSAQSADVATLPSNRSLPTISGAAEAGVTLTGSTGTWSGSPTPTVRTQWRRCAPSGACQAVGSATKYPLTAADVGSFLQFEVTATNAAGSATASARTATVTAAPPASGTLVALWSMDETSGTTVFDGSGNGHHGTSTNVGLGAAGVLLNAYHFGGAARAGGVVIRGGAWAAPGAANVTISMYVNLDKHPPASVEDWDLLKLGTFDKGEFKVEVYPNGRAFCGFAGTGGLVEQPWVKGSGPTTGPDITDGVWHKITCRKTAGAVTLLVDDRTVETVGKAAGSIDNRVDDFILGRHAAGSEYFDGYMDEVSIRFG